MIAYQRMFLLFFVCLFAALASFAAPNGEDTPISVRGTVCEVDVDPVDTGFVFLVLDCGGQFKYAYSQTDDFKKTLNDFQPFIGRYVHVSGHKSIMLPGNRFVSRPQIVIKSSTDIATLDSNAKDPFATPDMDSPALTLEEIPSAKQRRTAGLVLARWHGNRVMLRKSCGDTIMVELQDGIPLPAAGECIEVAGTPETDLYRIHLLRAIWRKSDALPTAIKADTAKTTPLRKLFWDSKHYVISPAKYGNLLTVTGTLREFVTDETGEKRLLLEQDGFTIQIDCGDAPSAIQNIEIGSLVSATGVCVVDSDFWRPTALLPKTRGLFLVARSEADIVVLKSPPWWTPARFIVAASVMGGIIVLILIWNVSLRVLVRRRTREAIKAQSRKLESEFRVAERTRLAADLHDSFSQNMSIIGYHVAALQNSLAEKDTSSAGRLSTVAKMIKSCLVDLRRCLWDLRNDVLDEPDFAMALRRTVGPVAADADVRIRFDGRRSAISDATAHALLNIARELVANAVMHGRAKHVRIAGEVGANGLSLSVRDDGCGFDPGRRPGTGEGHFGIDGIKARLEKMNGTLDIESSHGKGTHARIRVPVQSIPTTTSKT